MLFEPRALQASLRKNGDVVIWSKDSRNQQGGEHQINNKVTPIYGVLIAPDDKIIGEIVLKPYDAFDSSKVKEVKSNFVGIAAGERNHLTFVNTTQGVGTLSIVRLETPVDYPKYVKDKSDLLTEELAAELGRQELIKAVRAAGKTR